MQTHAQSRLSQLQGSLGAREPGAYHGDRFYRMCQNRFLRGVTKENLTLRNPRIRS